MSNKCKCQYCTKQRLAQAVEGIRPAVIAFARRMEDKLIEHDRHGRQDDPSSSLFARLAEDMMVQDIQEGLLKTATLVASQTRLSKKAKEELLESLRGVYRSTT